MSWRRIEIATETFSLETPRAETKDRPRFGKGKVYKTPRTEAAEDQIKWAARSVFGMRYADFDGGVEICVYSYHCLPEKKPAYCIGRADYRKPDIDNTLKLVMDALNGIAYKDDSHVTKATAIKMPCVPHKDGNWLEVELKYYVEERVE